VAGKPVGVHWTCSTGEHTTRTEEESTMRQQLRTTRQTRTVRRLERAAVVRQPRPSARDRYAAAWLG
jgi:hypothetical protein